MHRHLAGILAGTLTALASFALTAGVHGMFGGTPLDSWSTPVDSGRAVRNYSSAVSAWGDVRTNPQISRGGLAASTCELHECSDGTRVFDTVFTYTTPESANFAYSGLESASWQNTHARAQEDRAAGWLASKSSTWMIFKGNAIEGGPPSPYVGDSSNAQAWVEGCRLHVVFGPSPVHIDEYVAGREAL